MTGRRSGRGDESGAVEDVQPPERCEVEAGAGWPEMRGLFGVAVFPGVDRSPALARRFVREVLGANPAADTVELCVSELVTNAVRYSASGDGGRVTVAIAEDGDVIRCEVTDDCGTPSTPHLRDDPGAEHGRGLIIVDAVCTRWGVTPGPESVTVWCECTAAEGR
ncbi:ATP-binding protein [Actinomadura sp. B10D3]|uniref:ATP-binding protein n=1 Tax=Actinomadura sp. B10D3 TaxID=3153557 RepID=UPI00325EF2DB